MTLFIVESERVQCLTYDCRTTSDVVQELSHRVEELEEALQSALSTNTPVGVSPWSDRSFPEAPGQIPYFATSPATATGQNSARNLHAPRGSSTPAPTPQSEPTYKLSRCQLGNNWYFKGVGILSPRGRQWISEGAGQRVFLENFNIFGGNPIGTAPQPLSTLPERSRSLPPEAITRYLFGIFSKSKTSIIFPVLNRGLFEGTIVRAYDVEAPDMGQRASAEACVWAMLAHVVRTEEAQQFDSIPEADDCVQEVRRLLFIINGAVNLDSLEATLLLVGNLEQRK